MKSILTVLVVLGFAAGSVFAGDCCGKKKDGDKKDAPKEGVTQQG